MSTKVFDAWRIPKEEAHIHALVELSHTVAQINATDFVDEVVATLRNYPWLDDIIVKLKQIPDGIEKLPILSARAMMPAIALNSMSLCYTMSDDGRL